MVSIIGLYMVIGVLVNGFELCRGFVCYRDDFDKWQKEAGEWNTITQIRVAITMVFLWPKVVELIIKDFNHN